MGRTQDIRALTFPKTMIVKAALLCYLVLTPAVFSFTVPAVNSAAEKQSSEVEARQFSDDDIINYGIWGFIAGLSDYFIRNAVTASAATTTTTTTTTTAAPRFRQKHKHHKKDKKEKQQRKKDKKAKRDQKKKEKEMEMEAENAMKAEVEAVVVEESVPVEVVEDSVAEIVADVE